MQVCDSDSEWARQQRQRRPDVSSLLGYHTVTFLKTVDKVVVTTVTATTTTGRIRGLDQEAQLPPTDRVSTLCQFKSCQLSCTAVGLRNNSV